MAGEIEKWLVITGCGRYLQHCCNIFIIHFVNERLIGRYPTEPEKASYLSPNNLLLGCANTQVPSGPFEETNNLRKRFLFVQTTIGQFWKRWTSLSSLYISFCVYSALLSHHLYVTPLLNLSDTLISFGFLAGVCSSSVCFSLPACS